MSYPVGKVGDKVINCNISRGYFGIEPDGPY